MLLHTHSKVIMWSLSGYHNDAVKLVVEKSLRPRGLTGLYQDNIDYSGEEIKKTFDVFADETNYPIIIHCTQGKDRTGLLVFLLLLLTDAVPLDMIAADYALSESELQKAEASVATSEELRKMRIYISDNASTCLPDFVPIMKNHLDSVHGGLENYLLSIGVSRDQLEKIKKKLLA